MLNGADKRENTVFQRKNLVLRRISPLRLVHRPAIPEETPKPPEPENSSPMPSSEISTVLVINASHEMAKEITLQLTLGIPTCSIMYAPSIHIARWILARRHIDLVVSSPILPDGPIGRLRDSLEKMASPPNVVVVGNMNATSAELFGKGGYEFSSVRRLGELSVEEPVTPKQEALPFDNKVKSLGADLRNDLNNPLQEIVAMVFVAQAGAPSEAGTSQALNAIEKAAKNMAKIVSGLEDRIKGTLRPSL